MKQPIFSIIVPLYNKKDYIKRCIESILSQSYTDFELIVIDDGSTDGSSSIANNFSHQDNRIVYLCYDNSGVSIARNRGLQIASGEYILFVDADDWVENNYLAEIHTAISKKTADIYIWGLTKDFANHSISQAPTMNGVYSRNMFLNNMIKEQYGKNEGLYGYICNKAIRRELIVNNNLHFNPEIKLQEDYDFFLNCYRIADSFYCFNSCGYHYVIDIAPLCQRKSGNVNYIQLYQIAHKCLDIASENGSLSNDAKTVLESICANMLLSYFLEMEPISSKKIDILFDFLLKDKDAANIFLHLKTKHKILKMLLDSRNTVFTRLYLSLWNTYKTLRLKK